MAAATEGGNSSPKTSTEPGTGSDGQRSANDDRSDSLNDNNDAKKASDANSAEQAKRGS